MAFEELLQRLGVSRTRSVEQRLIGFVLHLLAISHRTRPSATAPRFSGRGGALRGRSRWRTCLRRGGRDAPPDARPHAFVQEVADGRVDVAHHHEAERDFYLVREEVDQAPCAWLKRASSFESR